MQLKQIFPSDTMNRIKFRNTTSYKTTFVTRQWMVGWLDDLTIQAMQI